MILQGSLATLAILSLALLLWQWLAARCFLLHQRVADQSFAPPVTLLKPLKGCDEYTESCLRSWLAQDYAGEIQILFGVAAGDDPVCRVVGKLLHEFPRRDAQLVVCPERLGPNAKVSKLAQLEPLAKHEIIVVSDADVRVPADLLANLVAPLRDESVGLANCFYRLANPSTLAMHWEAIAINADFWSQVLQGASFRKLDFALGAVMATRRKQLGEIGGFKALADCLADDYQLGHRIAQRGHRIELCPVVVECWSEPMSWAAVWKHQLRWARTIRVCQPLPYFFSILSNVTFWSLVWAVAGSAGGTFTNYAFASGDWTASIELSWPRLLAVAFLLCRALAAVNLQSRLTGSRTHWKYFWLVPLKDLLQFAVWAGAFLGNHIEWRGRTYRLRRDGSLVEEAAPR